MHLKPCLLCNFSKQGDPGVRGPTGNPGKEGPKVSKEISGINILSK